jgi:SNF2 family DNA or RNA helicase
VKTYGTLQYKTGETGTWRIECEPHVMITLKRVFARLMSQRLTVATLSDAPNICRDLQWFMDRYPLEMTDDDRGRLDCGADIYVQRTEEIERILGEGYEPPSLPLALPLRDYQARATQLYLVRRSLLLGDDVGLGKTAVGIGSLCDKRTLPAVVVTLTALPRQWQREIAKFMPGLHTHVVKKSRAYDLPDWMGHPPDVVIMNYAKLGLGDWPQALAKYARSVIFDECQELRRKDSDKWRACEHLAKACNFRLGLSATPIYGYGGELWNVLEVLAPGFLGSRGEFEREWCGGYSVSGNKDPVRDPKALGSYLRDQGVMLRRTRKEIGRELPPVTKIVHEVEADARVLEKVKNSAVELARIIMQQTEATQERRYTAAGQFDMIMRQATGVAKAPYVAEFCRLLLESEDNILVYAWHRAVYDVLMDGLRDYNPVMFTGSESATEKMKSFDAFTSGKSRVMLMSLRSGAGVDGLQQHCRTVVYGELDWSPGVHEQATGRIARDGQTDPVMAYYLIADNEDSSDPFVMQTLGLKTDQVDGIRDPEATAASKPLVGSEKHIRDLAEAYLKRAGAGAARGMVAT